MAKVQLKSIEIIGELSKKELLNYFQSETRKHIFQGIPSTLKVKELCLKIVTVQTEFVALHSDAFVYVEVTDDEFEKDDESSSSSSSSSSESDTDSSESSNGGKKGKKRKNKKKKSKKEEKVKKQKKRKEDKKKSKKDDSNRVEKAGDVVAQGPTTRSSISFGSRDRGSSNRSPSPPAGKKFRFIPDNVFAHL